MKTVDSVAEKRKIRSRREVDLSLSARLSIHTYDWNRKFGSFYPNSSAKKEPHNSYLLNIVAK